MTVFKEYAEYYDRLYRDKDYAAEAAYVDALIQRHNPGATSILDLGCGTGSHDVILAEKGYRVTGIDRSVESIEKALAKSARRQSLPLCFRTGEIQSLRMTERFDAVVSLFHVMSYLTTDTDLVRAFETGWHHLRDGGIFIFDCWYGPAVLTDPPEVRIKRVSDEAVDIVRIAEPEVLANDNMVNVNYQVLVRHRNSGKTMDVRETHPMRYWFKPEIDQMLSAVGFHGGDCMEWVTGRRIGSDTWNVCFIGKKAR